MTTIDFPILVAWFSGGMSRIELDCKNYKSYVMEKQDENNKLQLEGGQNISAQRLRLKIIENDKNAANLTI